MSLWSDPAAWLGHEALWILYAVIALAAFVKYVVPILPGDMVLLICVFLVGAKGGSGWVSVGGIMAGGTAGALLAFWWGRRFGDRFIMHRPRFVRLTDRVEAILGRWGYWPLLLNRFVPYVRPALFPAAGMLRMLPLPVALSALAGNALFGGFLVLLAHGAGRQWGTLSSAYHLYQAWLGLFVFALLSLLAFVLILGAWKSKRVQAEDTRG